MPPSLDKYHSTRKPSEFNLFHFNTHFNIEEDCIEYLEKIRWPNGIACPHCSYSGKYYVTNRGYKCSKCLKKYSIISGTLLSNFNLELKKLFYIIYFFAANKNSISSFQLEEYLGISQKTTWAISHKIRCVLKENVRKLKGIIEVDEAFLSKKKEWQNRKGNYRRSMKTPVLGLIERGGPVIIVKITHRTKSKILEVIERHVEEGSTIYTDGAAAYKNNFINYKHDFVDHKLGEYFKEGGVHTNSIERIWGRLKRSVRATHSYVSEKHVQIYCDETAWRYNHRNDTTKEKFDWILKRLLSTSEL